MGPAGTPGAASFLDVQLAGEWDISGLGPVRPRWEAVCVGRHGAQHSILGQWVGLELAGASEAHFPQVLGITHTPQCLPTLKAASCPGSAPVPALLT